MIGSAPNRLSTNGDGKKNLIEARTADIVQQAKRARVQGLIATLESLTASRSHAQQSGVTDVAERIKLSILKVLADIDAANDAN